ncbi:MAG: hypothetical protein OEV60_08580 [Actinomycetota bacterium]|nr:hypothetical protein [Actinomycetota bacterium]MDH5225051.1 hypothetical protein [Actinomycetota bacterium]MDH5314566.1 hypothetical protein [Actinomycetota bacterium]
MGNDGLRGSWSGQPDRRADRSCRRSLSAGSDRPSDRDRGPAIVGPHRAPIRGPSADLRGGRRGRAHRGMGPVPGGRGCRARTPRAGPRRHRGHDHLGSARGSRLVLFSRARDRDREGAV